MRFLRFAVIAALLALPVQANAGVLGSFLSGDGIPDIATDESVGRFFDNDGDGAVGVGDDVVGFQSYRNTSAYGNLGTNDQLNTMFAFRVGTSTHLGSGVLYQTAAAIPVAAPTSLQSLLGMPGLDADSIAAIFTSHSHAGDFLELDFASALAFVSADMLDGTLALKAGDFLEILTQPFIDANGDGKIQIPSELPAASAAGTPFASESGGFTYVPVGTNLGTLLPVSAAHLLGGPVSLHDFGLSGQLLGPTTRTDTSAAGFNVTDKTTIAVNPVPEPGTLAIWSVIGLIGFRRRTRR